MNCIPASSRAVLASNRIKDVRASTLCATCVEDCNVLCEVAMSAVRGPEAIYPKPYGNLTAGAQKVYPLNWEDFSILGTAVGAHGQDADPDKATFPNVKIETTLGAFGGKPGIKLRLPLTIPGLGSTNVAKYNWEGLAMGAALSGVLLTVGENVVGMDSDAEIKNGKVVDAPDLRSRVKTYKKYQREGYGAIVVQENVEDNRLGVLEYAINELGVDAVELKWGQGAKDIGGEVKIRTLEKAQLLKKRGYIVLPDPLDKESIAAFKSKVFTEFERHSRLGMVTEEGFAERVRQVRNAGAKYVFLKTGAYKFSDLARAIAFSSKYKIDVLTIDAAGGGTGMSPWRMMNEWGTPPIETFSKTIELCNRLKKSKKHIPDIVFAGGFALEDHIVKGLAFGAPFVKAIGMSSSVLTATMKGKHIGMQLQDGSLSQTISEFGKDINEIFFASPNVKSLLGKEYEEISKDKERMPSLASGIAVYGYYMRLSQGIKQLMAGLRKFDISKEEFSVDRKDIIALTKDAAEVSGIHYIMEHDKEEVEEIMENA